MTNKAAAAFMQDNACWCQLMRQSYHSLLDAI